MCRVNLGGHCQTESAASVASQYHYLNSPMSPGKRRRRRDISSPLLKKLMPKQVEFCYYINVTRSASLSLLYSSLLGQCGDASNPLKTGPRKQPLRALFFKDSRSFCLWAFTSEPGGGGALPRFLYAGVPFRDWTPHPSIRRVSAENLTLL